MGGYIKLWRKFVEWEWYGNVNTKVVFLHLLLRANYKDCRYKGHEVPRGSLITTISELGEALGLTPREVRTALENLKHTKSIALKTTNKFSIVNVLNYEDYQGSDDEERQTTDKRATNKRQTNDKPIEEEGKKGRTEKKKDTNASARERFNKFWDAYPLKVAKEPARKAWDKINPDDTMLEAMIKAITRAKQTPQWTKDGGQFIPHPSTWLNQRRWDDQIATEVKKPGTARDYSEREYTEDELMKYVFDPTKDADKQGAGL